jgi:hypothetical protein
MSLKPPSPRGGVLRALLWFVSILVLAGIAALFVYDRLLRARYEPVIAAFRKDVTASIGFFCEQQTLLSRDPWFHEPRTEGDAGPLLNAWVPWEPAKEPPRNSPLLIPAPLPRSNADLKDWLTSTIDVSTLDFEWMRKLHAYDRWDLSRNTPKPLAEKIDWVSAPLPYFVQLQLWSKFRLLHGLRTGQPVEAARDVRHLAWLAYRTDTLLGGAIATALLRFERQAYDSLPSPPPEWRPMSHEQLERMRAVIMSGTAFSNIAAPAEVARQARSCGDPVVSRCSALSEAAFMLKYLQPLAEERYRDAYTAHAEELTTRPCATALPQAIWERGVTLEEQRLATMPDPPEWLNTLPGAFAGSHIAGVLISVGPPSIRPLHDFRAKLEAGEFKPAKPD